MSTSHKILWIVALIAAAVSAVYLGVSPWTVLVIGFLLLCPLAIYLGMGAMHKPNDKNR